MALTEHEHLGFSYNTEREKLKIPEYGRTLQQMVDYCVTIEDRDERNRAARRIIDVMGDLYDPSPMELTHNPAAIDKQKRLIDRIHSLGADVVISSHMACPRTAEQVFEHLSEVAKRGADVVKIVTTVNTDEELAEAFRTTLLLKRELGKPFIHLCNGTYSRPHRFMGPALGVSIFFCISRYEPRYGMTQPTIRAMKSVLRNMHWNINDF